MSDIIATLLADTSPNNGCFMAQLTFSFGFRATLTSPEKRKKKVLSYPNRSKGKKVSPNLIQTIIFTFSAQLNQLGDAFCLKKKKSINLEEYTWIHIKYFSQ